MTDSVYTKDGRSIRLEIENGVIHRLELCERGEAVERAGVFASGTLPGEPVIEPAEIPSLPGEMVESVMAMGGSIERATLLAGAASHTFRSDHHDRQWGDQVARIHLSLVNRRHRLRCELDRSGRLFEESWLAELIELERALSSCRPGLEVSGPVTLEPAVSAALLAYAFGRNLLPDVPLAQSPRPGEIDGKGNPITARPLPLDSEDLPWFRPSYRTPPRRIAHGVDLATPRVTAERHTWRAIALTGDPAHHDGLLRARCLLTRDEEVTVAMLEIGQWNDEIEVVTDPERWFPFLAGVWGRTVIFRGNPLRATTD